MSARLAAFAVGSLLLASTAVALAEPMDPALERLVIDPSCRNDLGVYQDSDSNLDALEAGPGKRRWCAPDHASFKKMMNQYGFAFAPTAMHSARTTGYGGFHLSLEAAYTKIDDGAAYWVNGTQGPVDPSDNSASVKNSSPQSILQLYSVKFRKGFGFGLEITGAVGFMPKTSIVSGGADVRLSVLEGFRTGVLGVFPDIAVGGGVRTITGTPQFQLTTVGLDAQISKPLPIADSQILTPWIGFQYLWIFADSGLVDLTPGTDGLGYCNYAGNNVPGNPDPDKAQGGSQNPNGTQGQLYDGQPVCNGGSPLDFNNNVVFNNARLERQRVIAGVNYRYEMVMVGGEFLMDLVPPGDAQNDKEDKELLKDEDRQWTLVFELGGMF
jgi:hypothetical protein